MDVSHRQVPIRITSRVRRATRRRFSLASALLAVAAVVVAPYALPRAAAQAPPTSLEISAVAYEHGSELLTIEGRGALVTTVPTVTIDGRAVEVLSVDRADGVLIVVIEASSSTAGGVLARSQALATSLIEALPPGVAVGVISFGDAVSVVAAPDADHDAAIAAMEAIGPTTVSALNDALTVSAELAADWPGPRVIAFFGWGWDFGGASTSSQADVLAAHAAAGAAVHAYPLGFDFDRALFEALAAPDGGVHPGAGAGSLEAAAASFAGATWEISARAPLAAGQHRVQVTSGGASAVSTLTVDVAAVPAPVIDEAGAAQPTTAGSVLPERTPEALPTAPPVATGTELPWPLPSVVLAVVPLVAAVLLGVTLWRRRRKRWAGRGPTLARAFEHGDISLHYQPIFDPRTRGLVGAEALLRRDDGRAGSVAARTFMSEATRSGLLPRLTSTVLLEATQLAKAVIRAGYPDFTITVNVSPAQVLDGELLPVIRHALHASALPAERLILEVGESLVIENQDGLRDALGQLAPLGVRLSIDDFWAPARDTAAIDIPGASFVKLDLRANTGSEPAREQMRAAVTLAHARGLLAVAKRVETEYEIESLEDLQCDLVQGNAYGVAQAADEFMQRVRELSRPWGALAS